MDFQECLSTCGSVRSQFSRLFHGVPESFSFTSDGRSVIFLSSARGGGNTLYAVSLGDGGGNWVNVCSSAARDGTRVLSRSEQLLRERMRATGRGITKYHYFSKEDRLLVVDGPRSSVVQRETEETIWLFPEFPGAIDYKLCPSNPALVACVYDGDVWVLDAGHGQKHQLTHTGATRRVTNRTAGQPSFIIQEEFDRYTGYWWQPDTGDGIHRIVYEEVDEGNVEVVHTFNPSKQAVDRYQYPRPGCKNADSTLKLLEFHLKVSGEVCVEHRCLPWALKDCFPDFEYLLRVGWLPGGKDLWFLLLDREQRHMQLTVLSQGAFTGSPVLPYILWEEESEHWVEVTDILEFSPSLSLPLHFLISSETTGYRHLYLVEATPPRPSTQEGNPPFAVPRATWSSRQLTTGDWVVFGSHVWVDWTNDMVYFEGNATTPLEKHLYAVSLSASEPCSSPTQLTPSGYSHTATVDMANRRFVSVHSSGACPPRVMVYSLSTPVLHLCTLWQGTALPPSYSPPTYFSFRCKTGELLHGMVYPPMDLERGQLYPTVIYCYGGPQIQLVTNEMSRFLPRIRPWIQEGFAVLLLDNRGSSNRGIRFSAYVKGQMGSVEVVDQAEGLQQAARITGYIDLSRVAITGWSYGGYLSLMCLALKPDVFKVAIAGAPVTDWLAYDTGYTERYLGVPPRTLEAYIKSSVLSYAHKFPTEPNRLLILHGLSDENVFFTHTSLLLDRLVQVGRPYQLQVYPQERHGLRSSIAAIHCDATVLGFLISQLKAHS